MVSSTFIVNYDDIQSHTYTLCHHCWAVTRRRLVLVILSPALLFIAYLVLVWSDPHYSGTTFLIVLATFVLIWAITIAVAKSREPWHRLKRLAVKERGGQPFVVFEGSEDGSNMILPV